MKKITFLVMMIFLMPQNNLAAQTSFPCQLLKSKMQKAQKLKDKPLEQWLRETRILLIRCGNHGKSRESLLDSSIMSNYLHASYKAESLGLIFFAQRLKRAALKPMLIEAKEIIRSNFGGKFGRSLLGEQQVRYYLLRYKSERRKKRDIDKIIEAFRPRLSYGDLYIRECVPFVIQENPSLNSQERAGICAGFRRHPGLYNIK